MANINMIGKTVADEATPEALGASFQRFKGIVFYGGKGTAETPNTSTAYVQVRSMSADGTAGDWGSCMPVPSAGWSAGLNLDTTGDRIFDASQFMIKVGTKADGVVAIVQS